MHLCCFLFQMSSIFSSLWRLRCRGPCVGVLVPSRKELWYLWPVKWTCVAWAAHTLYYQAQLWTYALSCWLSGQPPSSWSSFSNLHDLWPQLKPRFHKMHPFFFYFNLCVFCIYFVVDCIDWKPATLVCVVVMLCTGMKIIGCYFFLPFIRKCVCIFNCLTVVKQTYFHYWSDDHVIWFKWSGLNPLFHNKWAIMLKESHPSPLFLNYSIVCLFICTWHRFTCICPLRETPMTVDPNATGVFWASELL